MTDFDDAIEKLRSVLENTPGASAVFEGLEGGDLTAAQAYSQLESLLKTAGTDLTQLGQAFPIAISTENSVPMVLEGDNGLPMLNPLVEAAIAELASIDGDVPQMRSGPLPENATPAIPVDTTVADPVMLGMMLQAASKQVEKALQNALEERKETIKALEAKAKETNLAVRPEALPARITGVEGYQAGALPAPLRIAVPTLAEVAALTPTQRRVAARKAIATTQGRRSLAPVVERMLLTRLAGMGVEAKAGSVSEDSPTVTWAMHSYADDEINEEFSPVEAAVGSLAAKVKAFGVPAPFLLTVLPINGVSERHFGWAVRFCSEER